MLEDFTIVLSSCYIEKHIIDRHPTIEKGEIRKEKFKIATTKLNTKNKACKSFMDCRV